MLYLSFNSQTWRQCRAEEIMVKSELITLIAEKLKPLPLKDVEIGINQILECMGNELCSGKRIEIRGFGSFSLHFRPARNAHNPRTGVKVATIPKHSPHFKPGKELRQRVNSSIDQFQIQECLPDREDE
jgi:integration host factor subunit beta